MNANYTSMRARGDFRLSLQDAEKETLQGRGKTCRDISGYFHWISLKSV